MSTGRWSTLLLQVTSKAKAMLRCHSIAPGCQHITRRRRIVSAQVYGIHQSNTMHQGVVDQGEVAE
jgi:hypothetical protein